MLVPWRVSWDSKSYKIIIPCFHRRVQVGITTPGCINVCTAATWGFIGLPKLYRTFRDFYCWQRQDYSGHCSGERPGGRIQLIHCWYSQAFMIFIYCTFHWTMVNGSIHHLVDLAVNPSQAKHHWLRIWFLFALVCRPWSWKKALAGQLKEAILLRS